MKVTREVESNVCDQCGEYASYECLTCHSDMCYECSESKGVKYPHSLHFSGSGDGFYCLKCDRDLRETGTSSLHTAYLTIQSLRVEEKEFYTDLKIRAERAENELKRERQKHGMRY